MTFWIISAYAIINAALFFSSLLLKDVAKKGTHTHYIIICIPAIAILAGIPQNLNELYEYFNLYNNTLGTATMAALPLLLLITAKIRCKMRQAMSAKAD
jgi:spore germination protein